MSVCYRTRRQQLLQGTQIDSIPIVQQGSLTLPQLTKLVENARSRFRDGPLEGVVVRRENRSWCEARAKLVRTDFVQAMDEHWRSRPVEWNHIVES